MAENTNTSSQEPKKSIEELNAQASKKTGFAALIENGVRKFLTVGHLLFLLPLACLYTVSLALAFSPGIYVWLKFAHEIETSANFISVFSYAALIAVAMILFILTLPFAVALCNLPLIPLVRSYRGPWVSLETLPWYYHNALVYLVRYTILELITPTPLNELFYRMMGMKIGKNVVINTTRISDPCLIELEDYVTIGGSATLMAHYGMKGFLVIDKLVIRRAANIGLNVNILGGVEIGEKATIEPGVTVFPKTVIAAGEKFSGVKD